LTCTSACSGVGGSSVACAASAAFATLTDPREDVEEPLGASDEADEMLRAIGTSSLATAASEEPADNDDDSDDNGAALTRADEHGEEMARGAASTATVRLASEPAPPKDPAAADGELHAARLSTLAATEGAER
jgi:hypothetical protein